MEPFTTWLMAKALLIIALATYFAGTFHIVRLFVAHRRALAKFEPDRGILHAQFSALEHRALYYLIWPSVIGTIAVGLWMLAQRPDLLKQPYVHAELGVMALLFAYHLMVHRTAERSKRATLRASAWQLLFFAQGASVLLYMAVLVLVMRDRLGWVWGSLGLLVVGGLIAYVITSRRRDPAQNSPA